ncbi:MAG: SPOR domain-containing protein [Proteobacteria bacterium]|nr:SPOR domain-containing protein [Pseudomonadota bacterium]
MITVWAPRVMLIALLTALAAGCSREQQDWHSAESADTAEAYRHFLEQHADSELARQAQARIAQLDEDREWQRADGIGTVDAYRRFLAEHPHGKWTEEARIRIEGFSLGSAPHAPREGPVSAARVGVRALQLATGTAAPAATAATPAPAQEAVPAAAAVLAARREDEAQPAPASEETRAIATTRVGGGYGIQLGAFGSQASAGREWERLQGRFAAQLQGKSPRIVIASTSSGALYRLQTPTAGEAEARALCDSLKEQAQACVPVLPR